MQCLCCSDVHQRFLKFAFIIISSKRCCFCWFCLLAKFCSYNKNATTFRRQYHCTDCKLCLQKMLKTPFSNYDKSKLYIENDLATKIKVKLNKANINPCFNAVETKNVSLHKPVRLDSILNDEAKAEQDTLQMLTKQKLDFQNFSNDNKLKYNNFYTVHEEVEAELEDEQHVNESKRQAELENFFMNEVDTSDSFSSERGSDTLLVTFDYGYSDSIDAQLLNNYSATCELNNANSIIALKANKTQNKAIVNKVEIKETQKDSLIDVEYEYENNDNSDNNYFDNTEELWYFMPPSVDTYDVATEFKVHRMQHVDENDSNMSLVSSFSEYDVDLNVSATFCSNATFYIDDDYNVVDNYASD